MSAPALHKTPLHALHESQGARFAPFAGYALPLRFPAGTLAEHTHTRAGASLFDVSHMGQAALVADPDVMERIFPAAIRSMTAGRIRYTLLLNEAGGICDDLMIAREGDNEFHLVVNAARKEVDYERILALLPSDAKLTRKDDLALLALQGPAASDVLARFVPDAPQMGFMTQHICEIDGVRCRISRCGYTGEDGFELSVGADDAPGIAERLFTDERVQPAGLGARDSLRLEAGLCLYGSDMDETTTPVDAALDWTIPKRRREDANFLGAEALLRAWRDGPTRLRTGFCLNGRAPARAHAPILDSEGAQIGEITSGGVAPPSPHPIAMGYLPAQLAQEGAEVQISVRGKELDARITALPFRPHRYYRRAKKETA